MPLYVPKVVVLNWYQEAEEKYRPERLDKINERIAHKESELKAHEELMPKSVPEPGNDQSEQL